MTFSVKIDKIRILKHYMMLNVLISVNFNALMNVTLSDFRTILDFNCSRRSFAGKNYQ
jgi:hypothetical protein